MENTTDVLQKLFNKNVGGIISSKSVRLLNPKSTSAVYLQNSCNNGILKRVEDNERKLICNTPQKLKDIKMRKKATKIQKKESYYEEKIITAFNPKVRENPNKRFIESFFLKIAMNYIPKSRCLVITGPDYQRHMTNLFDTIASEVYVCEIAKRVFKKILKQVYKCPYYKAGKVKLINCPVQEIMISRCRYIDLDLMGTIKTIGGIISNKLIFQSNTVSGLKAFSFTAGVRKDGRSEERFIHLYQILKSYLGAELLGFDGVLSGFGKGFKLDGLQAGRKHIPNFKDSGKIIDSHFFIYRDDTPMLTCLIIYK